MDFFAARDHPKGFAWDMTGDGAFTISDVKVWFSVGWDWFVWVFFLPGDFLISRLLEGGYVQWIGEFFEVSADWYGGWTAGIVSALFWLILGTGVAQLASDVSKWVQAKLKR